jgi:photosystem II stability/assembly factor-like uncharacterized protein
MKRYAVLSVIGAALLIAACANSKSSTADAGIADASAGDALEPDSSADASSPPDATLPDARSYEEAAKSATWSALVNAPKLSGGGKMDDVWFTSPSRGFAVSGPTSQILKTEDSGQSWVIAKQHRGTFFRSIAFTDDNNGFASNLGPLPQAGVTDPNVLYRTMDGGGTWTPVTSITGPMPTGICNQSKIDAENLIAVGRVTGPSYLMRSGDGGATWMSQDMNGQLQMLIDVHFTSPTEGIVIGGTAANPMKCTILRTIDGMSFNTVFTATVANTLCWKISFPSDNVGYVSIQNLDNAGASSFAKTVDGGKTWVQKPLVGGSYASIGIGFITENVGWVGSDDPSQPVYRTIDGGESWQPDTVLRSPVNRFRFVDHQTAYATGGTIYKLSIDWDQP